MMNNLFKIYSFLFVFIFLVACQNKKSSSEKAMTKESTSAQKQQTSDFIVAFGSCNKQNNKQSFWSTIGAQNPDIFIWGGDNIYADTDDMAKMKKDYQKQLNNPHYKQFINQIDNQIYGVWDDHDYGKNDAGSEWPHKVESQQLFLDFMGVDSTSERRQRKGVYYADDLEVGDKKFKMIFLDTRYHRSALQVDHDTKKRYKPWQNNEGTLLGDDQWGWFENQLKDSNADYHIIVSSIQIWSDEHGFETWGNFPHEVDKLKSLLQLYKPNNIVFLSGDRHISEFSKQNLSAYDYPIIDFTSSGLTHAYTNFTSEPNNDRVGEVVSQTSFGLLKYNFDKNLVLMEMQNENGVLQDLEIKF